MCGVLLPKLLSPGHVASLTSESVTISHTSFPLTEEGPGTKSQALSSFSGVPHLPSQEDVALDLYPTRLQPALSPAAWGGSTRLLGRLRLSVAMSLKERPREPVWVVGLEGAVWEERSRGGGTSLIGPSYTTGAKGRPRWGSCLDSSQ